MSIVLSTMKQAGTHIYLPAKHKITERGKMRYPPFGVDSQGNKIEDVRGHAIAGILEYVKEITIKKELESHKNFPVLVLKEIGQEAAREAVEKLISMLNGAIPDRKFWVTEAFLKNPWNSYSAEFYHFMVEFAKEISGEPDFCFQIGFNRFITPLIAIIGKPIPLEYIYTMVGLEGRFSKNCVKLEAPLITQGRAVLQIKVTERYRELVGEYFLACTENTCQIRKGVFMAAPQKMQDMPPARCRDIKCMSRGDEYCEMELTWEPRRTVATKLLLFGTSLSASLLVLFFFVFKSTPLEILFSLVPLLICYFLVHIQYLKEEKLRKERLISEQHKYVEERFKDLEDTSLSLQVTNIELNEKLRELQETQKLLEESLLDTVRSLSEAIDAKSPWTKGHSERVSWLACEIAKELGLEEEEIEKIR